MIRLSTGFLDFGELPYSCSCSGVSIAPSATSNKVELTSPRLGDGNVNEHVRFLCIENCYHSDDSTNNVVDIKFGNLQNSFGKFGVDIYECRDEQEAEQLTADCSKCLNFLTTQRTVDGSHLVLDEAETKWLMLRIYSLSDAETSIMNVTGSVQLTCSQSSLGTSTGNEISYTETHEIKISASFVTSILHADPENIYFYSIVVGAEATRSLQIWNRSECSLIFQFKLVNNDDSAAPFQHLSRFHLRLLDAETYQELHWDTVFVIAPYATKRMSVCVLPKSTGKALVGIEVFNMKNPTNISRVMCHIDAVTSESKSMIEVSCTDNECSSPSLGTSVLFDSTFFGKSSIRNMMLTNTSARSIRFRILNHNAVTDLNVDVISSQDHDILGPPPSDIFLAKTEDDHVPLSGRLPSLEQIPYEENDDDDVVGTFHQRDPLQYANGGILESQRKISSVVTIGRRDDFAGGPGDESALFDTKPAVSQSTGSLSKRKETETWNNVEDVAGKYMHNVLSHGACTWGASSLEQLEFDGLENDLDSDRCRRSFIQNLYSRKAEEARSCPDNIDCVVSRRMSGQASPLLPSRVITPRMRAHSDACNQPTDSQAVYCVKADDRSTDEIPSQKLCSWFEIPPNSCTPVKLTWTPSPRTSDINDGSLVECTEKLFIEWHEDSFSSRSVNKGRNSFGPSKAGNVVFEDEIESTFGDVHTVEVVCQIQYCMNKMSVANTTLDLGECSVGEFKTATLTIRYYVAFLVYCF
jgi:hypothetical protein